MKKIRETLIEGKLPEKQTSRDEFRQALINNIRDEVLDTEININDFGEIDRKKLEKKLYDLCHWFKSTDTLKSIVQYICETRGILKFKDKG